MIELNTGLKGGRGVSITDFTLDDDGNAVTTFDNGNKKVTKLTYVANASVSAKKAAISEANAKGYADKALSSETNARTSEANASTYANNASESKVAAKVSETNAKSSEKSAKSSEEISITKAEEALASATSASNSATKASESEVNSAKSAESAENSYNKTVSIQNNFQEVLDTVKTSEANAKVSEKNASASASIATTQANTATTQANNAKASASASATSASNAKVSETNAGDSERASLASAKLSEAWASSTTSPDNTTDTSSVTGKTQSSRSWALEAKASSQSASSSATTATNASASASNSLKEVSKLAAEASTSATNASTSASNASTSAEKAKTSETNAANSESNALQYKTSALESKTASETSASNASKSEINAKASMNSASASATAARTSATNANLSEEHAATSETNAKQALAESQKIQKEIESALTKVTGFAKYAGSVDNYDDLPTSGMNTGDVWNIVNADTAHQIKAGDNVIWNGKSWDNLSGFVDLSNYPTNEDVAKAVISTTYSGGTITFIHKDGTKSTATIGDTSHAIRADQDGDGNVITRTYYKMTDASTVHQSFQSQINSKQDKLTFDTVPTANSTNPVTSGGVKDSIDGLGASVATGFATKEELNAKLDKSGGTVTGVITGTTFVGKLSGNADTATKATQDGDGNVIANTYYKVTNANVMHKNLQNQINEKQDTLTFDSTPTANSDNPVTSDGIKKAIDAKTVDLSNYYTKTQVNAELSNYVTGSDVSSALTQYAKKTDVPAITVSGNTISFGNVTIGVD